ncbi:MAG: YbaN family protein [Erysipelothrix sp.]|jgi:uncharacterized membrane protein YbaN (DUF454 family)|nr:YbaN family protein [Erysipelothrix sp.]
MRIIYASLAVVMFVLGVIGAFLPVMPTTIFIIISVYFASKSSPKLLESIKKTEIFKEYYDADAKTLSMTLSRKIRILVVVFITLLISAILVPITWVRILLASLYMIKLLTFIFIVRTKEAS